jgi:hypothetical protein
MYVYLFMCRWCNSNPFPGSLSSERRVVFLLLCMALLCAVGCYFPYFFLENQSLVLASLGYLV